jgi:hypothetical protein
MWMTARELKFGIWSHYGRRWALLLTPPVDEKRLFRRVIIVLVKSGRFHDRSKSHAVVEGSSDRQRAGLATFRQRLRASVCHFTEQAVSASFRSPKG